MTDTARGAESIVATLGLAEDGTRFGIAHPDFQLVVALAVELA